MYFKYELLEDGFADITLTQNDMVATVRLDSKSPHKDRHPLQSAKHEAIHLLLGRLDHCARCRYVESEQIDEAVEEIVFKLEDLIGG